MSLQAPTARSLLGAPPPGARRRGLRSGLARGGYAREVAPLLCPRTSRAHPPTSSWTASRSTSATRA
eukprot:14647767-Alexandrium_andersonii.AAC.1